MAHGVARRDPLIWDPSGSRQPWFERVGARVMKPINMQGRLAFAVLFGLLAGTIPVGIVVALAGLGPLWTFLVFLAGLIGAPVWFLLTARGRVKV